MARIIELKWNCKDCDAKDILGRHKKCPSCGSPREKGEMKMSGLEGGKSAATVTDPELLKLAKDRPDWFCTHCSCGNAGSAVRCKGCGSPRYAEADEDHPDFQGEHRTAPTERPEGPVEPPEEPSEEEVVPPPPPTGKKTPNIADVWHKIKEEAKDEEDEVRYVPPETDVSTIIFGAAGGLLVLLLGTFIYWAFQTHEVSGSVQTMSWTREVSVWQWKDITVRKWEHKTTQIRETPPRNGRGERAGMVMVAGSCQEEHYDDERYVCGSHQECEDVYRTETETYSCSKSETYVCGETCSDNGNGFATCRDKTCTRSVSDTCTRSVRVFDHEDCETVDDYCSRPIYKTKCSYLTQEWTKTESYPTRGSGKTFVWGKEPAGDEIRLSYQGYYEVVLGYEDDGQAESRPIVMEMEVGTKAKVEAAAAEYLSWEVGQKATVVVNNLGGVHKVLR